MAKPKLILYSPEPPLCICHNAALREAFECNFARTVEKFKDEIDANAADAAVFCLCSAPDETPHKLLQQDIIPKTAPILVCAETFSPEFIILAVERGVERFFSCQMAPVKIEKIINKAIRHSGLMKYFSLAVTTEFIPSPYANKFIQEILHAFPLRLKQEEIARRLGKSRSWVQKFCRQGFGIPYTRLLRRLWVYQALRMMQVTSFSNGEIALHLNYSEESNLARDFRKELGCSPSEARQRLLHEKPEGLIG